MCFSFQEISVWSYGWKAGYPDRKCRLQTLRGNSKTLSYNTAATSFCLDLQLITLWYNCIHYISEIHISIISINTPRRRETFNLWITYFISSIKFYFLSKNQFGLHVLWRIQAFSKQPCILCLLDRATSW